MLINEPSFSLVFFFLSSDFNFFNGSLEILYSKSIISFWFSLVLCFFLVKRKEIVCILLVNFLQMFYPFSSWFIFIFISAPASSGTGQSTHSCWHFKPSQACLSRIVCQTPAGFSYSMLMYREHLSGLCWLQFMN